MHQESEQKAGSGGNVANTIEYDLNSHTPKTINTGAAQIVIGTQGCMPSQPPDKPDAVTVYLDSSDPNPRTITVDGLEIVISMGHGQEPPGQGEPKVVAADEFTVIDDITRGAIASEDSAGNYSVFEMRAPPGEGVPLHRNHNEREVVYVVEGEWEVRLGDSIHRLKKGDVANMPPNHPHALRNMGETEGKALFFVSPGGLENFFIEAKKHSPRSAALKALEERYGITTLQREFPVGAKVLRQHGSSPIRMVEIPPGAFNMGSPESDNLAMPIDRDGEKIWDERPQHRVRITKRFALGKFPVTIAQFRAFVKDRNYQTETQRSKKGSTGLDLKTGKVETRPDFTWENPGFPQSDHHPVTCVSWEDARAFCEWLSKKTNECFRLPTEAEWEYACRAGKQTRFYNGNSIDRLKEIANVADELLSKKWIQNSDPPAINSIILQNGKIGSMPNPLPKGTPLPSAPTEQGPVPIWEKWEDGYPFTSPVGQFVSNNFGLCDMLGNVGEWCSDWYDPEYYKKSPAEDPQGSSDADAPEVQPRIPAPAFPKSKLRVVRGGVWLDTARDCRCADRQTAWRHPVQSAADIGFRVLMEL